ncbi:hypothetical protein PROFUN_10209 [Planoprotostelium fungivorum]|uniref:Uncharacterized protein n=1 Tax=Planoprotostelium fungivorum TaxID=1890364 RepID=A0A2P6MQ56_9EUKA|nr:hypothetical protein PROFUN_10209 [Planoprotostelium fungivorum]
MIFSALMVIQILMMMLFLLSSFPAGIAVIITLILTVGFYVYVRARFINLMAYLPIDNLPTAPLNYESWKSSFMIARASKRGCNGSQQAFGLSAVCSGRFGGLMYSNEPSLSRFDTASLLLLE